MCEIIWKAKRPLLEEEYDIKNDKRRTGINKLNPRLKTRILFRPANRCVYLVEFRHLQNGGRGLKKQKEKSSSFFFGQS